MRVSETLKQLRPAWLAVVSTRLARAEGVRESFLQQLGQFYEVFEQAVARGNPMLLIQVLDRWVEARTQTELEDPKNSLLPVVNQLLMITNEVFQANLPPAEALEALSAVLPVFAYAMEYSAYQETQLHVGHVSIELGKARNTLERLERSKSDFIAVAAHELKTPLTLIDGYAAMLSEIANEVRSVPLSEPQLAGMQVYIEGIHGGTRRLREIVDDMIDVSMIDNDLLSLNFQPVWISRVINLVQREVNRNLRDRKLSITIRDFPGSSEMTFGDGERLCQAFRNVLLNAIKYTPDGGAITVDGRQLPGFIEVTVTDTGIGIDAADHTRIFEKFGRLGNVSLHSSGKTKFKGGGPGLGLPITKGIIEAHGGAIWVESEGYDEALCPGATFHILLPTRKAPPDDKTAKLFHPLPDHNGA